MKTVMDWKFTEWYQAMGYVGGRHIATVTFSQGKTEILFYVGSQHETMRTSLSIEEAIKAAEGKWLGIVAHTPLHEHRNSYP